MNTDDFFFLVKGKEITFKTDFWLLETKRKTSLKHETLLKPVTTSLQNNARSHTAVDDTSLNNVSPVGNKFLTQQESTPLH